jgi:heme-degrading monooxygenase HmoA
MTCAVRPAQSELFSRAQQGWAPLVDVPGFGCQIGGWDHASSATACILAVWRDAASYAGFMRNRHDPLSAATGHAGTYDSLQVVTGHVMFDMPGEEPDGIRALLRARVLRVADCRVRSGYEAHFREVQQRVWAPAMARAEGMLGGLYSQLGPQRYIVTTGWRDDASHARYQRDDVPALRAASSSADALREIRGYVVSLTGDWRIRGR